MLDGSETVVLLCTPPPPASGEVVSNPNPTAISLASLSSVKRDRVSFPICFHSYSCRCSSAHRPSSGCFSGTLQIAVFVGSYKVTKLFEIGIPRFLLEIRVFLSSSLVQPFFLLFGVFHGRWSNSWLLFGSSCFQAPNKSNRIESVFFYLHSLSPSLFVVS